MVLLDNNYNLDVCQAVGMLNEKRCLNCMCAHTRSWQTARLEQGVVDFTE